MTLRPAYAIFSFNSFVAAMLALYIGFSMGLPRPYWAMLTVYITSQPLTGALRSKALFRVVGTILGAAAAVALVPRLVNTPILLSLAMAGWAGLCLYLSLLDRTPRAYIFMLAGYTAAIIGFPSVLAPGDIFETAVARVEEILLGIGCATLVHTLIFPRPVGTVLQAQIAKYLADARGWIAQALPGQNTQAQAHERRRLAADITELQMLATHLPFDTSNLRGRAELIRALQDQLAILLPLLSGVEDRIEGLRIADAVPPILAELARDVAAWAATQNPPHEAASRLQARCADAIAQLVPQSGVDWPTLLAVSALARMAELIAALQLAQDIATVIADPDRAIQAPLAARLSAVLRDSLHRPLHRDHGLAALSAFALVMAVLGCCSVWIATGWPDGAVAAMMAAVFSSFFATQDDPAPALVSFLGWTILSVPITALYLFAILPAIDGFPLLAAVLAPVFLVIGYLQADPRHYGKAMPLIIGVAGALSLQEVFTADFPGFLNSNLALIAGIAAALLSARLFRSLNAGWSARRILRRGWREIATMASRDRDISRGAWTSMMLDRLGLLQPRLAVAQAHVELEGADAMTDLRVGLNVIDLKAARRALPAHHIAADAALKAIAHLYAARAAGQPAPPAAPLLSAVDAAVREIDRAPLLPARRLGLVALAGLRRTLFADAPPYAVVP